MFKNIMAFAVAMTLALSASAESFFQIEAGIGESFFQTQGDGTWYQARFPHQMELNFPAIEVGLTGNLIQRQTWGVDWHLDYAYLGRVHVDATATPSDANYSRTSPTGCNGPCWPLANFVGNGNLNGFYLSIEPHYDVGQWKFGVEAGPFVFRPTWSETVYNWVSSPTATPQTLQVHNSASWRLGAMAGFSVSRGPFSVSYQYFWDKSPITAKDQYPAIWKGTHVLMLKYRF